MAFRPADPHGGSGTTDSGLAPGGPPATGGTADIDAALAALERRTRELVACADALEQRSERQVAPRPRYRMRGRCQMLWGGRSLKGPPRSKKRFAVVQEKSFLHADNAQRKNDNVRLL